MATKAVDTYTVIDEELADLANNEESAALAAQILKPRKRSEAKSIDEQAEEVAALAQEIAGAAAKAASDATLAQTGKQVDKLLKEVEAKIKQVSELYAKPQNLCHHIKIGDLPTVKLKNREAKILGKLITQSKIGMAGGNWPLLMGPTGCGKTVAAEQVAESLKLSFDHVNCSEGMSETWLWGRQTPTGFIAGGLWKAFKDGGVFLFDEADAANDNVWLSINTMLANGHAHNPINGESVKRHKDFIAIAATNTNGKGGTGAYSGRSRLDGATLNRFTMFSVSYDTDLERTLCGDKKLLEVLWEIRVKLTEKQSADVVSTRDIKNAYLQLQAGFTVQEILDCLCLRMDKANHALFVAKEGKK